MWHHFNNIKLSEFMKIDYFITNFPTGNEIPDGDIFAE